MDRADSVTLDPHKGLFMPYGTGALLVRDGSALRDVHGMSAGYLPGEHAGVSFRSGGDPILYINNPPGVPTEVRRRRCAPPPPFPRRSLRRPSAPPTRKAAARPEKTASTS